MFFVWAAFICFVLLMLALDLGVFHRKSHEISTREALGWTAFWICLALLFAVFIYFAYGGKTGENPWFGLNKVKDNIDGVKNTGITAAIKYITGYIVEESLSMDNIFVITMIMSYFAVPRLYQHRVLFWGVVGALVLRGLMIGLGIALIAEFHWILYVFGIFLIFTSIRLFFMGHEQTNPDKNVVVRLARKLFPVTIKYHGQHFMVRAGTEASLVSSVPGMRREEDQVVAKAKRGTLLLTPLAIALVMIETTDLIFAVDSIPAIFAITADPFLVFTSNIFAILGLRSLYFALAGMLVKFRFLKPALSLILLMIGIKMLTAKYLSIWLGEDFNFYVLAMVVFILGLGVLASVIIKPKESHGI
jgi:tellurite resistance protein TerC